jgi:hypothetical protein
MTACEHAEVAGHVEPVGGTRAHSRARNFAAVIGEREEGRRSVARPMCVKPSSPRMESRQRRWVADLAVWCGVLRPQWSRPRLRCIRQERHSVSRMVRDRERRGRIRDLWRERERLGRTSARVAGDVNGDGRQDLVLGLRTLSRASVGRTGRFSCPLSRQARAAVSLSSPTRTAERLIPGGRRRRRATSTTTGSPTSRYPYTLSRTTRLMVACTSCSASPTPRRFNSRTPGRVS